MTVNVGGIVLQESRTAAQDGTTLTISGREAHPPVAYVVPGWEQTVLAAHHNVLGLRGAGCVPVVFGDKESLTGFYRVDGAQSQLTKAAGGQVLNAVWQLTLTRLGGSADVEFESQVPSIARSSEVAGTASFWQAPPVGTQDYFTGSTVPAASVARTGAEGAVVAYRGIPTNVAPRWTVAASDYLKGSARISFDGIRHAGLATPEHSTWELSNSLLAVAADGPGITVAVLNGAGAPMSVKGYRFTVSGSNVVGTPEATVLRCDPEESVLRLSWAQAPGRVTVDLSLRRGSRFVTGVMKRHSAVALGITRSSAEAATAVTGGLRATSADTDGNRFVMGSSRTLTTTTATASIAKAATTRLDFFLGHEAGATPASGDAFADLFGQYLGAAGREHVRALRR